MGCCSSDWRSGEMPKSTPSVRCAVYTRKSTEEGLEQDFNSLQVQREAAEAFIQSQKHAGWRLLPQHYDDGGFTGGSLERPALQNLLADVDARAAVSVSQTLTQILVLEAADVELTPAQRAEELLVIWVEEVEAAISAIFLLDRLGDLVQLVRSGLVVLDGRDELQVATVGGQQQFPQRGQTVDGLLHLGPRHAARAILVFYLAVVLEERDVHHGGL